MEKNLSTTAPVQDTSQSLAAAYHSAFGNFDRIKAMKQRCGCWHCMAIFDSDDVTQFYPETDGQRTAICPRCGADEVLHAESGYPITEEFLKQLHRFY